MIDTKHAVINLHGIPESVGEDISRCLTTLYSVREGEQPFDRDFGLKADFQDLPANLAQNKFALEVIEKTAKYEPRVTVEQVTFRTGTDGQIIPVIQLKRGEL